MIQGLEQIFEYTNYDGIYIKYNCGQAAAATFIRHHCDILPDTFKLLERRHPPDVLFGYLGTSRNKVQQICKEFGLYTKEINNESDLKLNILNKNPAILLLGVSGGKLLNLDLPGGHWVVAYGYDDNSIYLSNYGPMPWNEFRKAWKSLIPSLSRMKNKGLILN